MKIFDKFKKAQPCKVERVSVFETNYPIDKSDWYQVFSACVGKAMTIQEACGEQVVKEQSWNVDFETGELIFGKDSYPVQFIGSESNSSNTWKWGWDNINGFKDTLLTLANETEDFGEQWNLSPLTWAGFELNDIFNGHNLSIVACGISKINYCYYRGAHKGGAVFMGFTGVPDSVFAPVDLCKFIHISTKCIQQFEVDHKIFIESYLLWNGTEFEWDNHTIVAHFGQDLHIEFEKVDEFLRICSMRTK